MRMQRRDIRYRLNKKMKIFGNGDQWGAEGEDLNSRAPTGSSMATDKPASLDMAGVRSSNLRRPTTVFFYLISACYRKWWYFEPTTHMIVVCAS